MKFKGWQSTASLGCASLYRIISYSILTQTKLYYCSNTCVVRESVFAATASFWSLHTLFRLILFSLIYQFTSHALLTDWLIQAREQPLTSSQSVKMEASLKKKSERKSLSAPHDTPSRDTSSRVTLSDQSKMGSGECHGYFFTINLWISSRLSSESKTVDESFLSPSVPLPSCFSSSRPYLFIIYSTFDVCSL